MKPRRSPLLAAAAAAALLAGRAWGHAPADSRLKDADALVKRAAARASEIQALAKAGQCPAGTTTKSLVRDFAEKKFGAATADALPDAAKADVRLNYSCRALSTDDPSDCKDLSIFDGNYTYDLSGNRDGQVEPEVLDSTETEKVKWNATFEARCVARFKRERMVRAIIAGSPKAFEYCRVYADDRQEFRADGVDAACKVVVSHPADRSAACRTLEPLFIRPVTEPFCLQLLSELNGDAGACPQVNGGFFPKHTCEQFGQYRAALAGKNAGLCQGGMCRMWMGAGIGACEFYGPVFRSAVCGRLITPGAVEDGGKELTALVEKARLALRAAEDGAGGRVDVVLAREIDAREEALARLMNDYDEAERAVRAPDAAAPR